MREKPPKLILCVIDAMAPAMLERAVAAGRAPVLCELMARGRYVPDCVSAFPSVTPVCAASITTGLGPEEHLIPAMNWYWRERERYVEYGSSFRAAQRFGIAQQLMDTIYNMNSSHLAADTRTVFELLDDAQVRTACTTYLIYRGRHRHEPQRDTAVMRVANALMRHPVMGPRELFYADIFASRPTGCRSTLGMPGVRDRHSGCVGSYLVRNDLFDFMLLSLPDNDWHSHKHGPAVQVDSIARADLQLARLADAAGGLERFLQEHAVIVMSDHSQAPVAETIDLRRALEELGVLGPGSPRRQAGAQIAVCPSQRAAMVYVLDGERREELLAGVVRRVLAIAGVDLVMWLERDAQDVPSEAIVRSHTRGELRFMPGPDTEDARGAQWSVEGALEVLDGSLSEGRLRTRSYPDALARIWSALLCPTAGDVVLSAAPGHEFCDWGGQAHAGGGSHGSLHRNDSLAPLVMFGLDAPREPSVRRIMAAASAPEYGEQPDPVPWTIKDVAPLVAAHFGLARGRRASGDFLAAPPALA